jgi:hypothetical protein
VIIHYKKSCDISSFKHTIIPFGHDALSKKSKSFNRKEREDFPQRSQRTY